ncbi:urease accessory protein UreD [Pseudorhodoplanes sp.]|uniref:urease accessory protein UreD n=1 Tax=Pseudorhodoplanes sp. TaxID=1934341 RepID=UPI00391CFB0C
MAPGPGPADKATVFARNRAHGLIDLSVSAASGRTRRDRVTEQGSFRVRLPDVSGPECEAVILNTAGGIAGGDEFTIAVTAGPQTQLAVTTAAAEKVYRAIDAPSRVAVRLMAAPGAVLRWLPQETILFDEAKLNRSIEADIAAGGSLVLVETTIFGRTAMSETVRGGGLVDRWRIRLNGSLVFADTLRLDGDISALLARPAAGGGATAFATLVIVPGDEALAERARACLAECNSETGVSAWNGIAVLRLCASDAMRLRRDLVSVLNNLCGALPRLWAG